MKTKKSMINKLSALLMALVLICTMLPVQADAATMVRRDMPVLCAALDSNGDVVEAYPGIPIEESSGKFLVSSDDLYIGSSYTYAAILNNGNDLVELDYSGTTDGFSLFTFSFSNSSVCCKEVRATVGQTYTLQIYNTDAEVVAFSVTVTGYNSTPTESGFYQLTVQEKDGFNANYVLGPGAVLDSDGDIVAMAIDEGTYFRYLAFGEPSGSSSGGGSTPTRPNPETPTTPAVPDTPDTPDIPDTPDTPDTPDNPETPTNPTNPGGDEPAWKKYMIPIIGAVALIVLAVVAVVLLKKPKGGNGGNGGYPGGNGGYPGGNGGYPGGNGGYPGDNGFPGGNDGYPGPDVTRPIPPTGPNGGPTVPGGSTIPGGWEQEPAGMSLVDTCGVLGGGTFPISKAGALIGRAANADIRYPADTKGVSRDHCRIYWQGETLMLVDNNSTSGTYIQGKGQLRPGTPVEVREGDVIYLGSKKISLTVRTKY